MPSCNFVRRPAGAQPLRRRVSPPAPVVSLATASGTGSVKRRRPRWWAMGMAAPQPLTFPDAQGAVFPAGHNDRSVHWGKERPVSGGVCDEGTHAEDGPGIWEAFALPRYMPVGRRADDPSPTHDTLTGAHVVGHKGQGKTRPMGIAAFEDKVVQDAVREVLEGIDEQDFLDGSYGCRPGRRAHDAGCTLDPIVHRGEVAWIRQAGGGDR